MNLRNLAIIPLAVLPLLAVAPPADANVRHAAEQGVNLQADPTEPYNSADTATVFANLARDGVNQAVLTFPLEQDSVGATVVKRREKSRYDRSYTPSDAELVGAIRNARKVGLKVVLKPHLELPNSEWRAHIVFDNHHNRDADRWAKSWGGWMKHYARILKANGGGTIVVGTEQYRTTLAQFNRKAPARWIRYIIKPVEKACKSCGVTYASYLGSSTRTRESLLLSKKFVHALRGDLGVNYYPHLNNQPNATAADFAAKVRSDRSLFAKMQKRYGGHIVISEVGLKTEDRALQARWYEGTLGELDKITYVRGVWLYRGYTTPDAGSDPADFTFTFQNKPSEQVVARFFGGHV